MPGLVHQVVRRLVESVGTVIIGKQAEVEQCVLALLCRGHLLIEDVPGVGKTLLAKSLARATGCRFERVQFTPDLLPSDVTGVNVFNPQAATFEFRQGPVFTQILLADEINRATPKTQSSLLEAMEERQVTVDGVTRRLPEPFMVMATENPVELAGTYPLPEAQVDRFLMKILVDYPTPGEEAAVVGRSLNAPAQVRECLSLEDLRRYGEIAGSVIVDRDAIGYAVGLVDATRNPANHGLGDMGPMIEFGASPRGPIGLVQSARVLALLRGRGHVVPEDIRDLAADVLRHRIVLSYDALSEGVTADDILDRVLAAVPQPGASHLMRERAATGVVGPA